MSVRAAELPKTLFEMAGARPEAGRLSNSVLVIVDAQREYVDGALPLVGVDAAIAEIDKLLARARKSGAPVIHIVHKGNGALFNPNTPAFEIVAPLRPQADEAVIEKMRVSAFSGTGLEEVIQRTGRKNLVIIGFMTHNCVSSTARAARDLGYAPTVVAAATATRDLPDGRGGIVTASALQAASLAALADRIAAVVPAESDIPD
ncbi:MAG: isochorismatase [Gallionellales bacterium GWA2_60_142]|nr:MAG: isochorismatase [Gallionellales bacterium GWA2_60_142]HCI13541.1 cysteine hydrolase [Gallionellaceae bacterium]